MHTEKRENWVDDTVSPDELMRREMVKSLGTMMMVEGLIVESPNFHFLRGNHDDIQGKIAGDFRKYANENKQVREWFPSNWRQQGTQLMQKIERFEDELPLMAIGNNFVVTHAFPEHGLQESEIRKAKENTKIGQQIQQALTWTENGDFLHEPLIHAMDETLGNLGMTDAWWIVGHRPVGSGRPYRAVGTRGIQINDPRNYVTTFIPGNTSATPYDPAVATRLDLPTS